VVFLDPPRSGSTEQFLDAMISMNPKKVVYISCNPVTLERDLSYLVKKGYEAKEAIPVDMFPGTEHVEVVTLLARSETSCK
jgi:23S rRNA (uracil1939-C5)-methyltransferase